MTRTSLPPGFRFHPTDVELIKFYLKRKVMGKRVSFEVISEIDVYKYCPWDLPEKSCLRSKDLEWYFFSPRERKYSNGARMNRATNYGYWKTTGKDRSVLYNDECVGMIKTLIFHRGKPPKGDRTDWVMHEYRLEDKALADAGIAQDAYVICKIFQKSGPGPKNGAQYGAPFNEEEWSDDEVGCTESFVLTELSAPPPTHQNNPNNSAVTSTFIPGTTLCTGFSSETTHSHLVQCPDNRILPLPGDDVSIFDIPLPPPADLIFSLEDCLTDDATAVPDNLEHNENLDKLNHGGLNHNTALDVNNVYEDLGELGKWGDSTQYYSSGGSENYFATNQMIGNEDCFFLEDLECPLDGPSNMNGLECITADTMPPNYDLYNSSEQPCYPFKYTDPVQHGSSVSHIQPPLVSDGPGGTYWYENNRQINNSEATFWNLPYQGK